MNSLRSTVRVWAIAFTIAFVACKPASPLPPIALGHPPLVSGVAALINRFGFELYDELRDRPGNVVVSPVGPAAGLAHFASTADPETRAVIAKVLHTGGDYGSLAAFWSALDAINPTGASEFLISATGEVSANAGQPTRLASSMVLRTMWTTDTVEKQKLFSTAGGSVPVEVDVQLPCHNPYAYAHLDGVQLLQIPSGDCPVNDHRCDESGQSLLIILPDDPHELPTVERRAAGSYERWLAALGLAWPEVEFPRWQVTSELDLGPALHAMGVPSGPAGLDLATQHLLFLGGWGGWQSSFPPCRSGRVDAVFHADHPFLYIVRNRPTGMILFIGRVADPR